MMKKILFIHHSTGGLLLQFGKVRKLLYEKNSDIKFWDHGYNLYESKFISYLFGPLMYRTGLSNKDGKMTGKDFNIIVSNNSPEEYAEIFSRNPSDYTLKNILSFDIVIFKNCFPTTKIETKEKLENYKRYYSQIIKSVSKYKNKFIIFTPPPLRREMTTIKWAGNARELSDWLSKQETDNVKVFNFFDLLTDSEGKNVNMLKREYCNLIPFDSHPNIRANKQIGKVFTDLILKFV